MSSSTRKRPGNIPNASAKSHEPRKLCSCLKLFPGMHGLPGLGLHLASFKIYATHMFVCIYTVVMSHAYVPKGYTYQVVLQKAALQ